MQAFLMLKWRQMWEPLLDLRWLSFQEMMIGHSGWLDCLAEQEAALCPLKPQQTQRVEGAMPSRKEEGFLG